MQIVRDLAGYSYGRSDLVRRAMAKKKASVMEKERRNFVYGNEEEGVKGCIANGISEQVANKIFDEMTDFARYAFNKSHAACYAVVAYQTAYLKCYFPVEFMAALMTSVMDNAGKVAGYILTCRQMGIELLPPNINEGVAFFSTDGDKIRYALSAIKGVGRSVIEAIVAEREQNGTFTSLVNFIERLSGKEINKRTLESFIKSGALDCLTGNRRQYMLSYATIVDQITSDRKKSMDGQISLSDLAAPEEKAEFEIKLPDAPEFDKAELLAMEKEMLGIYLSGHPLDSYRGLLQKNVTRTSEDFMPEEDVAAGEEAAEETLNVHAGVQDGESVIIGGMIAAVMRKTTKNNTTMAFLTLEDLFGTVEVIVFPRDYETYRKELVEDNKIFVRGRAALEENKAPRLICSEIIPFSALPRELWVKFPDKRSYGERQDELYRLLAAEDGTEETVVYCEAEKAIKRLPKSMSTAITSELLEGLSKAFGEDSVKVVEKKLEKRK